MSRESVVIWLRPQDSPPPAFIAASWQTHHYPITEIRAETRLSVPDHQCILFTSARAPRFLAAATELRRPMLCVGSETQRSAGKLGWTKCLSVHDDSASLQRYFVGRDFPEPLLYAHGTPLSVPPSRLLAQCMVRHTGLCCYRNIASHGHWRSIKQLLASGFHIVVPLLSTTTAVTWRANEHHVKPISQKLLIDYFCLSLRVARALGEPAHHETITIAKSPTLKSLLASMRGQSLF